MWYIYKIEIHACFCKSAFHNKLVSYAMCVGISERRVRPMVEIPNASDDYKTKSIYPELKFVVTRLITDGQGENICK